ncbi:unnamed protein product [Adineta steineri]|uniref:Uncharacterized protein n=1 Tax=Adineta steineri TaxID=433720 RepID=A0A816AYE1_9BILA|nr:unnamed protein product [Adineta steineri]CAF1603727.1 unnamed protein product [Adineta steineri]
MKHCLALFHKRVRFSNVAVKIIEVGANEYNLDVSTDFNSQELEKYYIFQQYEQIIFFSSYIGLATNSNIVSCACLGSSRNYYSLIHGEQFFKSSSCLSEQSSFGCSLFRLDSYVLHLHFIFEHKYNWTNYEHVNRLHDELNDEKFFYPFDFYGQQKQSNEQHQNINDLSITT